MNGVSSTIGSPLQKPLPLRIQILKNRLAIRLAIMGDNSRPDANNWTLVHLRQERNVVTDVNKLAIGHCHTQGASGHLNAIGTLDTIVVVANDDSVADIQFAHRSPLQLR